jgi:hypothetical protein
MRFSDGNRMTQVIPVVPETAAAWMGADMAATPARWTRRWSVRELDVLFAIAKGVSDSELTALDAMRGVPPPLLDLAADIREDLIHRHGFTLLKGFPVGEVDRRTVSVAFMILGSLIGVPRSQNASGHLLGHVMDVGGDLADPGTRIYQTNERQSFHTDSTDAVGLLCLHTALSGGRSQLASAETVYRIVRERRPDLAAWLFEPIATDRRGEIPEGADPWFEIPVLSWFDGRLTVLYQRTYVDSAMQLPGAPRPASEHIEALDFWDAVVNEPDVHLTMDLEPGDMQFVYNHSLLHDRTSFVDDPDPARRRHLLRLWLSLPGDRRLPPVFAQRYGPIDVGDRGGIIVRNTELSVPLDAVG